MIRLPAPGHRVVVRYLLPDGQATDALGDLVRVTAQEVVVETRRGTVRIVGDTIVAAKAVPPVRVARAGAVPRGDGEVTP